MNDQIHIVGTNHISTDSLEDIKKEFLAFQPQIICVELDKQRFASLTQGEQKLGWGALRVLGVRGFLFVALSKYVQQKLGKKTGMKPGTEMLYAAQLAKNNQLTLGLIDIPIDQTIKRLMKKLRFVEVMRFFYDITLGLLPFGKKKKVAVNIAKIPQEDLIEQLIGDLAKRYPTVYQVLIDERNHYMARRLVILAKKNPEKKILSVVGAGHKKEMESLLEQYEKTIELV